MKPIASKGRLFRLFHDCDDMHSRCRMSMTVNVLRQHVGRLSNKVSIRKGNFHLGFWMEHLRLPSVSRAFTAAAVCCSLRLRCCTKLGRNELGMGEAKLQGSTHCWTSLRSSQGMTAKKQNKKNAKDCVQIILTFSCERHKIGKTEVSKRIQNALCVANLCLHTVLHTRSPALGLYRPKTAVLLVP